MICFLDERNVFFKKMDSKDIGLTLSLDECLTINSQLSPFGFMGCRKELFQDKKKSFTYISVSSSATVTTTSVTLKHPNN